MIFLIFTLTLIIVLYLEDLIRGRRKKFPTVQFIMKISKVGVSYLNDIRGYKVFKIVSNAVFDLKIVAWLKLGRVAGIITFNIEKQ